MKPNWKGPRELERLRVAIDELKQDPRNPRKHDARNLEAIQVSLWQFGQLRPIVVQRSTMQVVAGNGTMQAARALGWSHVAAQLVDLTDAEARAFAVADNRTGELAAWDRDNLAEILGDPDLEQLLGATGFAPGEVEQLLAAADAELAGDYAEPDPATRSSLSAPAAASDDDADEHEAEAPSAAADDHDEVPELPAEPITQPGDRWTLGEHEILCGDSLGEDAATWIGRGRFAAVVTDPPYAIFGSSTGVESDVADDKMVRPFFSSVSRLIASSLQLFGHAYLFTDWRSWSALWESMKGPHMLRMRNMLVWSKGGSGLGSNYFNCFELIAFAALLPDKTKMRGRRQAGVRTVMKPNLFEFLRPRGEDRPHNASKPVGLLQQLLENSTDDGDLVLEPFGGGGSTLIACELTGRRCRLIEIEPRWVDVIVARWEKLTGRKAERIPHQQAGSASPDRSGEVAGGAEPHDADATPAARRRRKGAK